MTHTSRPRWFHTTLLPWHEARDIEIQWLAFKYIYLFLSIFGLVMTDLGQLLLYKSWAIFAPICLFRFLKKDYFLDLGGLGKLLHSKHDLYLQDL